MSEADYYTVLGVRYSATVQEIKVAYYRKVRTAHPDAGGTAAEFRLVRAAYETLSDADRRADHDARFGIDSTPQPEQTFDTEDFVAPDADWGDEVDWDVSPRDVWADQNARAAMSKKEAKNPTREWVHRNTGRLVVRWGKIFAVGAYIIITYILFFQPTWIRPGAAGPDIFGWLLDQKIVMGVLALVYFVLLLYALLGMLFWALGVHLIVSVGMLLWPSAYWDIATTSERVTFGGVSALTLAYFASLVVSPWIQLTRYERDYPASFD